MHGLRAVVVMGYICALAMGCQRGAADERADSELVVTSPDPATAIEARYREGQHALVLRAQRAGAGVTSDLIDERGRSMTRMASAISERGLRTPQGALAVPVPALLGNTAQLATGLRLARHGLRQLRDAIGPDAADSDVFRQLSQQTLVLSKALRQTRLALLQEWGSEARKHIAMTAEEHQKFFAILQRQAQAVAAKPLARGRASAAVASSPEAELAALLGPERYAQYQSRRKVWMTPLGEQALEVVP